MQVIESSSCEPSSPTSSTKCLQGFAESLHYTSELSNFLIWKLLSSEPSI